MRPLIGIAPLWYEEKKAFWMRPDYVEGIREEGAVPFVLPLTDDHEALDRLLDKSDGILLTGGYDIDPSLYGEERRPECGPPAPERDAMELYLAKGIRERHVPCLGICRGIQLINVAYGGTLYQDLPTERPGIRHFMEEPYDAVQHYVDIEEDTPLHKLLSLTHLGVNSLHHQAVKELGKGLLPMAYSTDGLVEAVYDPFHPFLWAVQWHPERSFRTDERSRMIFRAFVQAASER